MSDRQPLLSRSRLCDFVGSPPGAPRPGKTRFIGVSDEKRVRFFQIPQKSLRQATQASDHHPPGCRRGGLFKQMAAELSMPYQNLINLFLRLRPAEAASQHPVARSVGAVSSGDTQGDAWLLFACAMPRAPITGQPVPGASGEGTPAFRPIGGPPAGSPH